MNNEKNLKTIRFEVTKEEYRLLEKIAKKRKLKHGVAQIFGEYGERLLKKVFNYETSGFEHVLISAQSVLDAFLDGEIPPQFREELRNAKPHHRLPYDAINNLPEERKK